MSFSLQLKIVDDLLHSTGVDPAMKLSAIGSIGLAPSSQTIID
ncbi:hypothetical protein N9P17_07640 [Tateyamaria sp.]|nr:hypothetical protein [Tateyamaria sp.]